MSEIYFDGYLTGLKHPNTALRGRGQERKGHDAGDGAGEEAMPEQEGLVPVREAARQTMSTTGRVYAWIKRGKLSAQRRVPGLRVSASAVRALAETLTPPAGPSGEYVPSHIAARMAGVKQNTIGGWSRRGKVATRPGPYGQLVRLADVLAYAAQRDFPTGECKWITSSPIRRGAPCTYRSYACTPSIPARALTVLMGSWSCIPAVLRMKTCMVLPWQRGRVSARP